MRTWSLRPGEFHGLDQPARRAQESPCPDHPSMVAARLEAGDISKTYLALVFGKTGDKGVIRRELRDARRKEGHAVVGDDRYRQRGKPTVPGFPGRLWLHAKLPDGQVFEAPLPAELEAHLTLLREAE